MIFILFEIIHNLIFIKKNRVNIIISKIKSISYNRLKHQNQHNPLAIKSIAIKSSTRIKAKLLKVMLHHVFSITAPTLVHPSLIG